MLVETAIVMIVLVLMSFGVTEFALLLGQADDAADALRAGSRAASMSGTSVDADYQILQAMKDSNNGLAGGIVKVVVYKASSTDGAPTGSCASFQTVVGQCTAYGPSDFNAPSSVIQAESASGWDPLTRMPGTDYVGINVQATHNFVTKLFGSSKTFGDRSAVILQATTSSGSSGSSTDPGLQNGTNLHPPYATNDPNQDGGSSGGGGVSPGNF